MPELNNSKTPGMYINKLDAFPPSIVGVQTAIPAFIGYTERSEFAGKPLNLTPVKIFSLADYEQIFGKAFKPVYKIVPVNHDGSQLYDFQVYDQGSKSIKYFNLTPAPKINFILYYCLKLFYANGGGTCYIVSVGNYKNAVNKDDFINGLNAINEEQDPTLLVIPETVLLPNNDDFQSVIREILQQCGNLRDRFAILDIYRGDSVTDEKSFNSVIEQFRNNLGDRNLNCGAGYFPFLDSVVADHEDFNYSNLAINNAETLSNLKNILHIENKNVYNSGAVYNKVSEIINSIGPDNSLLEIYQFNNILSSLPVLVSIINVMIGRNSILPPSGAIAGVYTYSDATMGVWNAPANISLSLVTSTSFKLNNDQQGNLNVPLDGRAINAIRDFTGRGSLVWGARTFMGNSNDYRYIQVKRTIIYIEQSIQNALNQFVFAPNDSNTWSAVISMTSNFLQEVWAQGGLMGEEASEAFTIRCGLGSTMTGLDILNGYMIVQVMLQMIRPAEYIELTFKQKMETV